MTENVKYLVTCIFDLGEESYYYNYTKEEINNYLKADNFILYECSAHTITKKLVKEITKKFLLQSIFKEKEFNHFDEILIKLDEIEIKQKINSADKKVYQVFVNYETNDLNDKYTYYGYKITFLKLNQSFISNIEDLKIKDLGMYLTSGQPAIRDIAKEALNEKNS